MRTTVETLIAFRECSSLVLTNEQNFAIVDFREADIDRPVVAERPVAVKFDELVADQFDVVARLWTILMSSDLNRLPRIQTLEHIAFQFGDFHPHVADRFQRRRSWPRLGLEFRKLFFKFYDWPLKRQHILRLHESRPSTREL